jgi:hypothetical protein
MKKKIGLLTFPLMAAFVIAACTAPSASGDEVPSSSSDQVATVVAATMQALTPIVTEATSDAPKELLPHTFYYLGSDAAGLTQVFRIERDGTTQRQITFEAVNVKDYDVSRVDGSVVYVANNQMFLVNADGSDRTLLVDGGAVDENNPFLTNINAPVFSPNGQTIAYGYKGLNLYAIGTGISNREIENDVKDSGSGFMFPNELYWPQSYSPDGTKLLITLGYYEGASSAIFYPDSNVLVRLSGGEGALICCGETQWSADGADFHAASSSLGMFNSGLWRVDAASGAVTTLFASSFDTGSFIYADEPYLALDGRLYYFFLETNSEIMSRPPLQLVRSAPDGITGRMVLLPDTFELMNEALWPPDAGFVVVAFAPTLEAYQGGRAEVVYLDGRPKVVLTNFAQQMKWGP